MLLTKLHTPAPAKNLVYRRRLFDQLDEGLSRKLILVSAPAGYGKTVLFSQWVKKQKIPTAWFSIDARDNDPYDFFTFLISSIQAKEDHIGKKPLEFLQQKGAVQLDYILELLIKRKEIRTLRPIGVHH